MKDLIDEAAPSQQRSALRPRVIGVSAVIALAGASAWWWLSPTSPVPPPSAPPAAAVAEPAAALPVVRRGLATRALSEWLGEIADESGLGLVAGPALERKIAAVFPAGSRWDERLAALAGGAGLAYRIERGVIEIEALPASPVPIQPTSAAPSGDELTADAAAPAVEAAPTLLRVRPSHARAVDLAKALSQLLRPRGVGTAADAVSNSLLLSGPADAVAEARRVALEMDVPYRRFVVEAQIIEMLDARRSDLGVQWRIAGDDAAASVNFPSDAGDGREGEVTIATGGTVSLNARISALEADGRARVVARPRVLVVEGRSASIESVKILRVRLPDSTSVVASGEDTRASSPSRAVEEFPVGITLQVEPALLGGDRVSLRVTAKSSTLGEPLPPDDIPEELSRMVEADFFVAHGETAVLGGLARAARSHRRSGVPVLREIPGVGLLFGRRARERDDEQLVVLVTPYLLE
jgi:type II secretory pathway component GspD/PulD (secretin)